MAAAIMELFHKITKACTKCGNEKHLSCFHVRRASRDGLALICKPCAIAHSKEWAKRNPEKLKASSRRRYLERDVEKDRERLRQRRLSDPARHNKERREWSASHKSKRVEICKRYYEKNKMKFLAAVRLRQADKIKRTPKWADKKAMVAFYKNRPPGMEVDHIVPLRGKNVCGLHVHNNLQYLTMSENRRKSFTFSQNY